MRLSRRAATAPEPAVDPDAEATLATSKGRPTPKRRDSIGRRGPVTAPKTRKEAYARQKELAKEQKRASRTPVQQMTVAQRRSALKAGDASVLPRRDQGRTRKLARDYVDSHRMLSNYMLWLFPIIALNLVVPAGYVVEIVVLVAFIALLIEWYLIGRRIREMAIERYGSAEGGPMTLGFYSGSRAYLPRKWRLPAPQVERGDEI